MAAKHDNRACFKFHDFTLTLILCFAFPFRFKLLPNSLIFHRRNVVCKLHACTRKSLSDLLVVSARTDNKIRINTDHKTKHFDFKLPALITKEDSLGGELPILFTAMILKKYCSFDFKSFTLYDIRVLFLLVAVPAGSQPVFHSCVTVEKQNLNLDQDKQSCSPSQALFYQASNKLI